LRTVFFDISQILPFLQVVLAAFLGGFIGLEREVQRREAGLRTFSLIALGSCFFTVMATYISSNPESFSVFVNIDPSRVIQAVAVGIGFVGSGLIIHRRFQVEGLTTAAALWSASAIGIGVGLGLYFLSILATLLTILVLTGFRMIEEKFFPER